MEKKISFTNSLEQRIYGILEEPSKYKDKIVIIVHGYASHKNGKSVRYIANELTKRKINSLRIDLDGCGESDGEIENQTISSAVEDIGSAIESMRAKGYSKIGLFGSSAGGLATIIAALKYPEINRLALKAPVSDFPSHLLRNFGQIYIDEWKKKGYNYHIGGDGRTLKWNYGFFEDSKEHVMYDKAQYLKCPVLIIHGTADKSVDIRDSRKLIKKIPNGKLIELAGADHGLEINKDRSLSIKLFGYWFEKE